MIINSFRFGSGTPPPPPSIITSGLILHYDVADSNSYPGSGTSISDLSSGNHTGSLLNGVVFNSTSPKYLTFDGTNDYISVGGGFTSTDWTIDFWIRKTSYAGADYDRIWGMTSYRYEIALDRNNRVRFYDGGWDNTSVTLNTSWNNLVIAFTNSNSIGQREHKIYLNNVLKRNTVDGRTFSNNTLTLGSRFGGRENAAFDLNEIRTYNRQLTSTEISQNYNARIGRF